GIQKQCAAVFERGLWSRVATTQPRGLSSQGVALSTEKQKVFTAKSILQSLNFKYCKSRFCSSRVASLSQRDSTRLVLKLLRCFQNFSG
ncbi:MAG TPA: hypothetical protein VF623_00620, partial [Segetibacter sp.]